jgi:ankyrin repeat protein
VPRFLLLSFAARLPLLLTSPLQAQDLKPSIDRVSCESPLIQAIQRRDIERSIRLIHESKDINIKSCPEGETALSESIADGPPQLTILPIKRGADLNLSDAKGVSPLMQASFTCQLDTVSALLRRGANINAVDSEGASALMHAASSCTDGNIVALLLRSGANLI